MRIGVDPHAPAYMCVPRPQGRAVLGGATRSNVSHLLRPWTVRRSAAALEPRTFAWLPPRGGSLAWARLLTHAMWMVRSSLLARPCRVHAALGVRAYSRDPREAEHAATTVRGHRAERARRTQWEQAHEQRKSEGAFSRAWRAWRATPVQWKPLPIVLGTLVLVGVQARREYVKQRGPGVIDENGRPVSEDGPFLLYLVGTLPLNAMSRAWGWANGLTLPVWFRPYGFKLYAWLFGCNLDEMREKDLTQYQSLGEFFTRELEPDARPISSALLVSPADGTVLHVGAVEGDRVEQVKGLTYSLGSLLGLNAPAQATTAASMPDAEGLSPTDEHKFAQVNGIEYSVQELLGHEGRVRRLRHYLWGWVTGVGQTMKRLVLWKRAGSSTRPLHPASPGEIDADADLAREDPDEKGEAGIPTANTADTLGHYAQVAMQMGSEAIPRFDQQQKVAPGHRLFFAVVYLSPGDYHRFHSPAAWVVELRRHFRGELYSVSPYVAARLPNLFVMNERVALLGRWRYGFFSMTPVGATNVGSIRIHFDRELRTNLRAERRLAGTFVEATYNAASRVLGGQPLAAGDEMGSFFLGSTIVLVFEAPETFQFHCAAGDKVRVGQALGDLP